MSSCSGILILQVSEVTTLRKPRLSVKEQIQHMKEQGIKFTIMTEDEACDYLENNTYYFKLKEYAKLFDKRPARDSERFDQYINLEFAYLVDLSKIDSYLRKLILRIALDIEHYLKAKLISDFNKTDSDGYKIVEEFIACDPDHYESEFKSKEKGKACSNLVNKYRNDFAIWNIIEVLSFGDFTELFNFFYSKYATQLYKKDYSPYKYLINPVRILRNAAAHNNCLISSLARPYVSPEEMNTNHEISRLLGDNHIKGKTVQTNLKRPLVHDFCVLLYLYCKLAPLNAQEYVLKEVNDLFVVRMAWHKEYYTNHAVLLSAYNFTKNYINLLQYLSDCAKKSS